MTNHNRHKNIYENYQKNFFHFFWFNFHCWQINLSNLKSCNYVWRTWIRSNRWDGCHCCHCILADVHFNVNATDRTVFVCYQPSVYTVHVKEMHARKTSVGIRNFFFVQLKRTTHEHNHQSTHRTSFSISNRDKQIVHFSPSSSSISLERLIRLYLCGSVLRSITSCWKKSGNI